MAIFIIPSVFSVLMIVSGILAWKWPMPWEKDNRQRYSYPHYEGKLAQKDKDTWEMSQRFFGKVQFFMGLVHIFLEIPEVMLMKKWCENWKSEDVTIPALLCLCVPPILMILLGNGITTLWLRHSKLF